MLGDGEILEILLSAVPAGPWKDGDFDNSKVKIPAHPRGGGGCIGQVHNYFTSVLQSEYYLRVVWKISSKNIVLFMLVFGVAAVQIYTFTFDFKSLKCRKLHDFNSKILRREGTPLPHPPQLSLPKMSCAPLVRNFWIRACILSK